ncbi:sulfate adenylyltransferase subunit CysN [Neptunomonas qingdaonensis]|uniref:Sulfate adenylyltransferase subunit 1 n=1 Tax=Neptunomonas qingdaonensis TaxID=1045558 RepID=A0A1I2TS00_9GAMM|nr:sulfate adenylyltransferase subunit CysN [Neptunomonas qingdaonensis]SFG65121.1 bifunctional enzyme CysN/CysC [Neptunomonas qingdaonensis]
MSHQSELISTDIEAYLHQHENKELLRFLTCGSVDDGKSTLIGRLLHDSKMIYEDQLAAIQSENARVGNAGEELDLALLVDGLQAEREQGITIDVAYRYFSTAERKFIIADTPGHEQYTRNMATGASTCDLAIILIDARHGVQVQTKRHSFIVSLLGLKHTIVAINKMDLVDFSEERYEQIKADYLEFTADLELQDIQFVPLSALKGDNVVNPSEHMSWYKGLPLMETLNTVKIARDKNFEELRFPVQYVNRPNLDFRGYCGTLTSGIVKPGDAVTVLPSGKSSRVKSIVTFDGELQEAFPPMSITLTLEDEIDISRGDIIVHSQNIPKATNRFDATLVWMDEKPLAIGKTYDIKLLTSRTAGSVTTIRHQINVNTHECSDASTLQLNEIGRCEITLERPILADNYKAFRGTGSFIVVDRLSNATVAAGMIIDANTDATTYELFNTAQVSAEQKARRFSQQPAVIALSGEAAATETLIHSLEQALHTAGHGVATLIKSSLPTELSQHASSLADLLKQNGLLVLTDTQIQTPALTIQVDQLPKGSEQVASVIQQLRDQKLI